MKIFDCFMYFDEDLVLDIRLNTLDKYVDFFVIIESKYNHKGETKKLNFDINKYKNFKDKIIYLIQDTEPQGIEVVNNNDLENIKNKKYILNSIKRENSQRNYINYGLNLAEKDDWIIISDLDEIPKLNKFKLKETLMPLLVKPDNEHKPPIPHQRNSKSGGGFSKIKTDSKNLYSIENSGIKSLFPCNLDEQTESELIDLSKKLFELTLLGTNWKSTFIDDKKFLIFI